MGPSPRRGTSWPQPLAGTSVHGSSHGPWPAPHGPRRSPFHEEVELDRAGEPEATEEVGPEGVAGPVGAEVDARGADEGDQEGEDGQDGGAEGAAAPADEDDVEGEAEEGDVLDDVAGGEAVADN